MSKPNGTSRQTRVIALPGSLRRGSYNRRLLDAAREQAPAGMSVAVYEDVASIPLFSEDLESESGRGPESVRALRRLVADADALLVATPEYNQSIPGVLKNVIDWLSRPEPPEALNGKPVAIVGATSGTWGTRYAQAVLRHVLFATGSLVLPAPSMFVARAASLFDDDGRLVDPKTRQVLGKVLVALADWIDFVNRGANRPVD